MRWAHYDQFLKILSQNLIMYFNSSDFDVILFQMIFTSKVPKNAYGLLSFGIFQIKPKLQLQGLNLKLEF